MCMCESCSPLESKCLNVPPECPWGGSHTSLMCLWERPELAKNRWVMWSLKNGIVQIEISVYRRWSAFRKGVRCLKTRVLTLYNAVRLFFLISCAHGSLAVICVLQSSTSFMAASGAASVRVQECFPPSFISLCFLKGAIRWSLSWPKTALKFPFKQHAIKPARLGLLDLSEARALAACRRPWCPWPVILSG